MCIATAGDVGNAVQQPLPTYVIATTPFPGPVGADRFVLAMPNHLQLLFIASFSASFLLLLALSNFLSSKLRDAGYDISRLILVGLPHDDHHIPNQMSTSPPSLLDVRQSVVPQLLALLLAVATSAFIYLKFGRSGTSSFPTQVTVSSPTSFSQEACS
jgi:hypothetical protein